jgi:hypothetical protein
MPNSAPSKLSFSPNCRTAWIPLRRRHCRSLRRQETSLFRSQAKSSEGRRCSRPAVPGGWAALPYSPLKTGGIGDRGRAEEAICRSPSTRRQSSRLRGKMKPGGIVASGTAIFRPMRHRNAGNPFQFGLNTIPPRAYPWGSVRRTSNALSMPDRVGADQKSLAVIGSCGPS